jgi:hypothetical protein
VLVVFAAESMVFVTLKAAAELILFPFSVKQKLILRSSHGCGFLFQHKRPDVPLIVEKNFDRRII